MLILSATGMPIGLFKSLAYRKNGWLARRERVQEQVLTTLVESGESVQRIVRIHALGAKVLERYLSRLVVREEEISTKDAKLVSDIIANVDRIKRLDEGRPTEIVENISTMEISDLRNRARELLKQLEEDDGIVTYLPAEPNGQE